MKAREGHDDYTTGYVAGIVLQLNPLPVVSALDQVEAHGDDLASTGGVADAA